MKKAIIFDMDGTLVDSEPAITFAAMEVIRRLGYEAQAEEFKPFTGMGDDKFIGGVLESHGGTYRSAYKDEAYDIYCEKAHKIVKVYPWSKEILSTLHHMGYHLAVASASDIRKVSCNLDCIGVDLSLFDAIVTGSDVTRKKPAPDIFLKAAERIGLDPKDCIVAEDAVAGVQAAKAAGMTAIAVTTSFSPEALADAGADRITDDLAVLPGFALEVLGDPHL
ncbi:MAG: HAD family hydrolase [Ruminococcaceae bacterium]|nr:HAD family hydrolase [Oscillospiraceae bacterium]